MGEPMGERAGVDTVAMTIANTTSAPSELLRNGQSIGGRYRITGVIGRGGMADVYQGDDMLLERPVAIKILHQHLAADHNGIERFRREGMTLAAVTSPNVVAIHDIGLEGGFAYLVMQYIVGHTLDQEIAQHGKLSPQRASHILLQILDGLAALHARGLVHRDVKPSNVMLDAHDHVVLLDLGIAFDSRRSRLTSPNMLAGTPGYVAPELKSFRTVGQKSDIFQVGLLLVLLMTGRDPARVNEQRMRELIDEMPTAYAHVAMRALSPAPDRYATVAEMARALTTAREVCQTVAMDPKLIRALASRTTDLLPVQPRGTNTRLRQRVAAMQPLSVEEEDSSTLIKTPDVPSAIAYEATEQLEWPRVSPSARSYVVVGSVCALALVLVLTIAACMH